MSAHNHPVPSIGTGAQHPSIGQSSANGAEGGSNSVAPAGKKRKGHRAGKKKKRRQSFGATNTLDSAAAGMRDMAKSTPDLQPSQASGTPRTPFYRMGNHRNLSESSLESEALLDHR